MIGPVDLHELRPLDSFGDPAALLDLHVLVTRAVEAQRRYRDRRQHVTSIDLCIHAQQRRCSTRTRGQSHVAPHPLDECRVGHPTRGNPRRDVIRVAPRLFDQGDLGLSVSRIRRPRVVRRGDPRCVAAHEHQSVRAIRVCRRENHGHAAALRVAEQRRRLGSRSVHDGANVVHTRLDGRKVMERHLIRQPGPALVEQDQPRERRDVSQHPSERRVLPRHLEVGDPAGHVHDVDRPLTQHLIGNADIAGVRIERLRCLHRRDHNCQPACVPIADAAPSAAGRGHRHCRRDESRTARPARSNRRTQAANLVSGAKKPRSDCSSPGLLGGHDGTRTRDLYRVMVAL